MTWIRSEDEELLLFDFELVAEPELESNTSSWPRSVTRRHIHLDMAGERSEMIWSTADWVLNVFYRMLDFKATPRMLAIHSCSVRLVLRYEAIEFATAGVHSNQVRVAG